MPRRARRKSVDEIVKQSSEYGEIRLVAGIDPEPRDPHPNAIFYIRMESQDRNTKKPCETESIWLSLNEMTRLGILMNIASRFWVERLDKGESYSKERIEEFVSEYQEIKEALERLLPKEK
jgi:hypothetical protein